MSHNDSNWKAIWGFSPWVRRIKIAGIVACGLSLPTPCRAQLIQLAAPNEVLSATSGDQQLPGILDLENPATSAAASDQQQRLNSAMTTDGAVSAAPNLNLLQHAARDTNLAFLPLGAREIGCQAAQRWNPAIGLRQRAQTIQRLYCEQSQSKRQAANGIAQFLCLQACHQEDLAAAAAMRAYYSRIGIAEQKVFVSTGQQVVSSQQAKQSRLIEQGLAAGVDLSSLDRQHIDLTDQLLQAESQDDQLRRLLSGLTGVDYRVEERILEPLVVEQQILDCDALVATAICDRYDLQSWRYLYRQINEESAATFASIIATSVGSFGIPVPKMAGLKQLLCNSYDKTLLAENLRKEVATIIDTNESYTQQLVIEKCSQLQLAYQRHQLQLQRISSWEYRLKQIEQLETHGDARPAERVSAEAGLLKARSDESVRRLDAKLAEVSLAEAVGGLAGKCCRGQAWFPRPQ